MTLCFAFRQHILIYCFVVLQHEKHIGSVWSALAVVLQVCAVNARAYESAVSTSGNPTEDEDQFDNYLLHSNKQVRIST